LGQSRLRHQWANLMQVTGTGLNPVGIARKRAFAAAPCITLMVEFNAMPTNSVTETYVERFLAVWQDSKALSPARVLIVFFAGLALICGATAFIGAVPTRIYGHDIFIPLENGWRVINGQRPHLDFMSPWGLLWSLISALGLTISRHSVDGIGYGNAIVALIVGSWSFFLGKNRLASSPRIILSFFLAALVAAPYPLGISPFLSSHAMAYNRYGYALLGLILLESFEVARGTRDSHAARWIGGISTGAALSLTLFLKASYFLMAVFLIGVISLFVWRFTRQRILGIILGFSSVSTCMLAYLRFDVAAMLGDLRMAAGARAEAIKPKILILNTLDHTSVLLGVVLFGFAAALLLGNRAPQWRGLKLPIIGAFFFAADSGLMSTNAQVDGFPLCAVFAILVVSEITGDQQALPAAQARPYRPLYSAVLCLGALLFVPQFTGDVAGLAYGAWRKERPSTPAAVLRFTLPDLKPLLLYDGAPPRSNGSVLTTYVNDGVALLERETRPNETILTMDMTNPFPYALERRPPRGGILSPTYHYNISDGHRPSDDRYFGDADIVMVPKRPALDDMYYTDFYKAYEPGLKQRYNLAAETSWWWMYRRK